MTTLTLACIQMLQKFYIQNLAIPRTSLLNLNLQLRLNSPIGRRLRKALFPPDVLQHTPLDLRVRELAQTLHIQDRGLQCISIVPHAPRLDALALDNSNNEIAPQLQRQLAGRRALQHHREAMRHSLELIPLNGDAGTGELTGEILALVGQHFLAVEEESWRRPGPGSGSGRQWRHERVRQHRAVAVQVLARRVDGPQRAGREVRVQALLRWRGQVVPACVFCDGWHGSCQV